MKQVIIILFLILGIKSFCQLPYSQKNISKEEITNYTKHCEYTDDGHAFCICNSSKIPCTVPVNMDVPKNESYINNENVEVDTTNTINIVALQSDETKEITDLMSQKQELKNQLKIIEDKVIKFNYKIAVKYTMHKYPLHGCLEMSMVAPCTFLMSDQWKKYATFKTGYDNGFNYSTDYKYIIPKIYSNSASFTLPLVN